MTLSETHVYDGTVYENSEVAPTQAGELTGNEPGQTTTPNETNVPSENNGTNTTIGTGNETGKPNTSHTTITPSSSKVETTSSNNAPPAAFKESDLSKTATAFT